MNKLEKKFESLSKLREDFIESCEKRLQELQEIANEKGITVFGYEGPSPTSEDFDEDVFDEFNYDNDFSLDFCWASVVLRGYTFELKNGEIYFTLISTYCGGEDFELDEYYDDYTHCNLWEGNNWEVAINIIKIIEKKLGLS